MKKTIILGVMLLPLLFFALPSTAVNAVSDAGALGISEKDFKVLRALDGTSCALDPVLVTAQMPMCNPLVLKLHEKVLIRSQKNGDLYRVLYEGEGVVDVRLERYLPDGTYKAKSKLFLITNGQKMLLKRKSTLKTILTRVQNDFTLWSPVSEADFERFFMDCAEFEEVERLHPDSGSYIDYSLERCNDQSIIGRWEVDMASKKRLIMRVESNGEMYFIDPIYSHVIELSGKHGNWSLYAVLSRYAERIPSSLLNQIPTYN